MADFAIGLTLADEPQDFWGEPIRLDAVSRPPAEYDSAFTCCIHLRPSTPPSLGQSKMAIPLSSLVFDT